MFCRSCGMEQPEGTKFCKACGKPMAGAQPPPTTETPPTVAAPPPTVPSPGYPQPQAAVRPQRSKTPLIIGLAALAVVVIVVVVVLVVTLGGGEEIAGKYSNTEDGVTLEFELKSDGTFIFNGDILAEGTYEVNGNKLIMHMEEYSYAWDLEGTIEDGKINMDGTIYVKQ